MTTVAYRNRECPAHTWRSQDPPRPDRSAAPPGYRSSPLCSVFVTSAALVLANPAPPRNLRHAARGFPS